MKAEDKEEQRQDSSRSRKKSRDRKTSKKGDKDGDPSNTSKASGGFTSSIGKKGAAGIAIRVEKIEKYLQERFNWLGLPV